STPLRRSSPRLLGLTRRTWLVAGASAAAILVAFGSFALFRPQPVIAQEQLAAEVTGWLAKLPPSAWQPIGKLPRGMAIDPAVAAQPQQWQRPSVHASGWLDSVVAIDLTPPGSGPRAMLFVVTSSARFNVPTRPAATTRLALSGGFTGTAWQRQGSHLLFVLAIEDRRV